ncbi:MAG TPA: M28 family metallopeptidase [Clostridiaceae bacterium]
MRKSIKAILFIIILSLFYMSLKTFINLKAFSESEILDNIKYLSADSFQGRLAGTTGNIMTEVYLKNTFANLGLKPYNSNNYMQNFETYYPKRLKNDPFLRIVKDDGELVKTYTYAKDYKEDMLSFSLSGIDFNLKDVDMTKPYLLVKNNNHNILFYNPEGDNINFRSSYDYKSAYNLCILVTKDTLNDLKDNLNKGYKVSSYIPFISEKTVLSNVVAYLPGKTDKPPIIFSAHFDHLGTDLNGNVYNGALDNGSGISFLLELSKYVKTLGKPDRSIIFAGFNGEEFGCLGSESFASTNLKEIKNSTVINFDMIGSYSIPLSIMAGKNDTLNTPLVKTLSSICTKENIKFGNIFEDSSDHEAFRKNKIEAITLCDSDMSKIHTLKDQSKYIDTRAITRCFKVIYPELMEYGYKDNIFIKYNQGILIGSIILSILLIMVSIIKKH